MQEILGHSDIKTTMRYAHPVPERKLKAIEALDNYVE
jgi:site-specific recombinase XerD